MRFGPRVVWCLLLLAGAATGATGMAVATGAHGDPGSSSIDDTATVSVLEAATLARPAVGARRQPDNNTTVRHRNPDERNEEGDLGRVKGYLSGKMGELVVDCSEGIRIGDYDPCNRADEEYPDFLEKYVDLTERTNDNSDDETAETFDKTRDDQRQFANRTREFRETYDEYREAREAGNTTRARRLARELIQAGEATNRTGRVLRADLRRIENRTGVATDQARAATRAVVENVTSITRQVETDLFTPANLTATATTETASLARPLVVTGRLGAEGEPLANRTITLRPVGGTGRQVTTRTNATGHYRLTYRPVTVPTGERSFRVRYHPSPTAAYLSANATVSVRVRPFEAVDANRTLSVEAPPRVDYGDRVTVRARLAVGEVGLPAVPLRATLAAAELGSARTDTGGGVEIGRRLPARVSAGERRLRVAFPLDGRALGTVTASTRVTVVESETDLRLSGAQSAPGEPRLRVTGRLVTGDGDAVREQPIRVAIADETVRTLRTNATGRFAATVELPDRFDLDDTGTLSVNASFDGTGTNLRGATARTSVSLRAADGEGVGGDANGEGGANGANGEGGAGSLVSENTELVALGFAVLLVLAAGGYLLYRRPGEPVTPDISEPASTTDEDAAEPQAAESDQSDRFEPEARLEAGDARGAILASYALARGRLADGNTDTQTHWEFYRSRADEVDPDHSTALRRLTELYEATVFGPDRPSAAAAQEAVEAVSVIAGRN